MDNFGDLSGRMERIDVASLALDERDASNLCGLMHSTDYYVNVCRKAVDIVANATGKELNDITLLDYGNGFGLLSVVAYRMGVGRVVCAPVDTDLQYATEDVIRVLGGGAEVIVAHAASDIVRWCSASGVTIDAVVALDCIDEVYVLDDYFLSLRALSPVIKMLFTTVANPLNKRRVAELRAFMQADEKGDGKEPGFYEQRKQYINKTFKGLSEKELDYWAENCRGLMYADIERAVETQSPNLLLDAYNTCNPMTGRWSHRVLPISEYRQLLSQHMYGLTVLPGFCNEYEHGLRGMLNRYRNKRWGLQDEFEKTVGSRRYKRALKHAPFIYLLSESMKK